MKNQSIAPQQSHTDAGAGLHAEFHVTYFDADCGRSRLEIFETALEAERFASRQCAGEDSWAVVDVVEIVQARIAA
ncbi:hypothetical protein V1639_09210 [Pseudarthrobacter sp. J75]|uniref:hypothetical protein n=1 Tax=unclassified Pseudarthrobacter TaxID=2647000 RepID=UPI002E80835F|nr:MULTISPECIES: hypothetical protein [unclassified Pseudarthrobacter]MEE2522465.1 hypothetical protein [Pseudarthrobacter sp. J47]MEE2529204.1 hypothetical protein [Pseudarthrobacter sp. J75]